MRHIDQNQLALHSTGDLDPRDVELVATHLAQCARCRQHVAEFERVQGIFGSLRVEPSASDLCDVRTRTMQAIQNESKPHRLWKWAPAGATVFAVILLFRITPMAKNPPLRSPLTTVQHSPEGARSFSTPAHIVHAIGRIRPRRAPGLRSIALLTAADRAPTIKITTSDPNVIILLPPDSASDERTQTND